MIHHVWFANMSDVSLLLCLHQKKKIYARRTRISSVVVLLLLLFFFDFNNLVSCIDLLHTLRLLRYYFFVLTYLLNKKKENNYYSPKKITRPPSSPPPFSSSTQPPPAWLLHACSRCLWFSKYEVKSYRTLRLRCIFSLSVFQRNILNRESEPWQCCYSWATYRTRWWRSNRSSPLKHFSRHHPSQWRRSNLEDTYRSRDRYQAWTVSWVSLQPLLHILYVQYQNPMQSRWRYFPLPIKKEVSDVSGLSRNVKERCLCRQMNSHQYHHHLKRDCFAVWSDLSQDEPSTWQYRFRTCVDVRVCIWALVFEWFSRKQ